MQWLSVVLMILKVLKQAKLANSEQEFVAAVQSQNSPLAANGVILKFLWDHREEIIELIMRFFVQPATFQAPPTPGTANMEATTDEAEVLALVEELKD